MIDLHMHTTYSDGSVTPEELVKMAYENGVRVFSITDHDTTNSYELARQVAAALPEMEYIPGIEINTHYKGHEVHVLGYYIDPTNDYLQEVCQEHNCKRHDHLERFVHKLQKETSVKLTADEVKSFSREGGTLGRPHIAKALVKKGAANNVSDAFRRYLVPSTPTYIDRDTVTPHEAVEAITDSGGLAVIAHPGDMPIIEDLTKDLMNYGLAGLEAYHRSHSPGIIEYHSTLAERLGLIVTGGTDYHGVVEHYPNALKQLHVPAWVYEKMQSERNRRSLAKVKAS